MFTLDHVVPWGRSFDEYARMFALTERDLAGRTLGCGDGPASFNAEATARGLSILSCDPIYQFDANAIRERIEATRHEVRAQTRRNAHEFVWDAIADVEVLERLRLWAMNTFLDDFERGRQAGRYVDASLPALPFADGSFDLALCSHLLFLYSAQLDVAFHLAAVDALCRVARDVRIFPLTALGGAPSPHLDAVVARSREAGRALTIERVPYEFQRGANEMLRITAR